jgi:hypothetical protein
MDWSETTKIERDPALEPVQPEAAA